MLSIGALGIIKAENAKPFVIPELRFWTGTEGSLYISNTTKVLYTDEALSVAAEELANDYGLFFGKSMKVKAINSTDKIPSGAIIFNLVNDPELGEEGYSIEISDVVKINAQTGTGAYWGTRTLLQILEQNKGSQLPRGTIRDWPDYSVRGFMLDCGRKYIPLEYLEKYAKVMAYYKMNTFQIHLNGNVHVGIQPICPVFQFLTYAVPLPGVPVGNMGIFRFPFAGGQLAILIHFPLFAADMAG